MKYYVLGRIDGATAYADSVAIGWRAFVVQGEPK